MKFLTCVILLIVVKGTLFGFLDNYYSLDVDSAWTDAKEAPFVPVEKSIRQVVSSGKAVLVAMGAYD